MTYEELKNEAYRLDKSDKLHKAICETAYKIVKNKFDKLKYTPEFYGFKNKKEMLKLIKSDIQEACWVLTELTNWGFVEGIDFSDFFALDKTECVYSIGNYNFIIELEKEGELYIYKLYEVKKVEKVITVWQKL